MSAPSRIAFGVGTTNGFSDSLDRLGNKWTKEGYNAVFGRNGRFSFKARTELPVHSRWKRDMEEDCSNCAARTLRWEWQNFHYNRQIKPEDVFIDSDDGIANLEAAL